MDCPPFKAATSRTSPVVVSAERESPCPPVGGRRNNPLSPTPARHPMQGNPQVIDALNKALTI